MKKITFLTFFVLVSSWQIHAQVSSYVFANSAGTYTENSSAATLLPSVRADDIISAAQNIGFDFVYDGVTRTQFKMSSNGFISFNMSAGAVNLNQNDFSVANIPTRPIIAPLWDDLDGSPATSSANYEVTGTVPNRVLTVEWRNWEWNYQSTTPVISFQVKLYETTNVIEFVYRQEATPISPGFGGGASIGLGGSTGSGAGSFLSLSSVSAPSVSSVVATNTILEKPETGQIYTFTPPTCIAPSGFVASTITTTTATISWIAASTAPAEGYQYSFSTNNVTPTGAGVVADGLTVNLTGLADSSTYYVWLRSNCGSGNFSTWNGPYTFSTNCVSLTVPFTETFDADSPTELCWRVLDVNADGDRWNLNFATAPISGTQSAAINTDSNAGANDDWLISPRIILTGNQQLKFKYRANSATEPNDFLVKLSTGGLTPADFTTVLLPLTVTSGTEISTATISLAAFSGEVYLAWHVAPGGLDGWILRIDDVVVEDLPTVAPQCIGDLDFAVNDGCGNFATTFTWTAVAGADGYRVSVGTSSNGTTITNLVVDNQNIASALTYSFLGSPDTTYYIAIRPFAGLLIAENCFIEEFTTDDVGCYCIAEPTSNDGAGITNVQIGSNNFPVTDVFYADLTGNGISEITQGVNTPMNVSFNTSFSNYSTIIWIDFNNNFNFEPSEIVFTGLSSSTNPNVLNTGFLTPLTAALGEHRMRIVATDVVQSVPNPCYNGTRGVVLDLLVDVLEAPSCLPPNGSSATNIGINEVTLNWVSAGTTFNVEYGLIGYTQGVGIETFSDVTGNTRVLTGLSAQTSYHYYVQNNCGANDLSTWAGPFTFRTLCDAFGDFTENFTTEVTRPIPECWGTLINSTMSTPSISNTASNDYMTLSTSGNAAAVLYLITPSLSALPLNTHRIKFRSFGPAGTSIVVGTMTDRSVESTFTPVTTIPLTTAFTTYSVSLTTSTTDSFVAFKYAGVANFQTVSIDDVTWEAIPLCPDVNVVTVVAATSSTADISWTPGGAETAWQYAYAQASVLNPIGLPTFDVATTPSATIIDLTPSTAYKVWVRSVCTNSVGLWSPAVTFSTACVAFDAPFEEDFSTFLPLCWTAAGAGTVATGPTGSAAGIWIADGFLNAGTVGATSINLYSTNRIGWLMPPTMNIAVGESYSFSFNYAVTTWLGSEAIAMGSDDFVKVAMSLDEGLTWTEIHSFTAASNVTNVSQDYTYEFIATTSLVRFAFVGSDGTVDDPLDYNFYIDNVIMELTPSCIAPSAPTATAVTATSATINWAATTPAPANGYDYYVSNTAVAPNAATVPTGSVAAGITTVDLMALSSSSVYRSYVRSICGTDDFSAWSSAGLFTTSCAAFDAPFLQNFDTFLPLCWTAAGAGTIATGPTGTAAGIWAEDGFLNAGSTGAVKANLYFTDRIGWLISPEMITTVGTAYTLSFNYGVTIWGQTGPLAMGSDDFVKIAMSTDNGVTWTEIHNFNAASNVTNLSQTFSTAITATTSQVRFAFIASDGTVDDDQDYDFFIDNVAFDVTLSNTDFDTNSFIAYPNPVKDVLNVSFEQNISDVTVYNLLGQQVAFKKMNADKGQIDLSNLASGTYLVRVNTENAVKTIKVIKQ
jgi:hypothetical protein